MQGLPVPQPLALVSMMVRSSTMVGNRQSQWLTNPPVCELPSSLWQLPTPVAPPFRVARKLVKAVPSGTPPLAQPEVRVAGTHHVYVSLTQWMPGQVLSFFSHWSPVRSSVTVPSPLSTKRAVVVVVLLVVVDVVAVIVVVVGGVAHSPAMQAPLQHWWFAVQVARFGLQLALLGSAPALRGAAMRSMPPTARNRSSMGVIRSASLSSRDIFDFSPPGYGRLSQRRRGLGCPARREDYCCGRPAVNGNRQRRLVSPARPSTRTSFPSSQGQTASDQRYSP